MDIPCIYQFNKTGTTLFSTFHLYLSLWYHSYLISLSVTGSRPHLGWKEKSGSWPWFSRSNSLSNFVTAWHVPCPFKGQLQTRSRMSPLFVLLNFLHICCHCISVHPFSISFCLFFVYCNCTGSKLVLPYFLLCLFFIHYESSKTDSSAFHAIRYLLSNQYRMPLTILFHNKT